MKIILFQFVINIEIKINMIRIKLIYKNPDRLGDPVLGVGSGLYYITQLSKLDHCWLGWTIGTVPKETLAQLFIYWGVEFFEISWQLVSSSAFNIPVFKYCWHKSVLSV